MSVHWLDRSMLPGPYFCLCLSQKDFDAALKYLKVPADRHPEWIGSGHDATTHHIEFQNDGETTDAHIVCIRQAKKTGVAEYALLVHEAVHIWRHFRKSIGEDEPGDEHEAYSIQHISQELMMSYDKQRRR